MSIAAKSRAEMAQDTTDRLIAVARHAFASDGFAAVSLDAVAAEAGVTRGALHHHFTNKAGLLEAVLRRIDAEIGAEIDLIWDATPDPWSAFQACFHTYLDAVLGRAVLGRDVSGRAVLINAILVDAVLANAVTSRVLLGHVGIG
ncbi:MAG: helix-turn-helix domain-containing protein, partial [Pseudomonadota bacterium]